MILYEPKLLRMNHNTTDKSEVRILMYKAFNLFRKYDYLIAIVLLVLMFFIPNNVFIQFLILLIILSFAYDLFQMIIGNKGNKDDSED